MADPLVAAPTRTGTVDVDPAARSLRPTSEAQPANAGKNSSETPCGHRLVDENWQRLLQAEQRLPEHSGLAEHQETKRLWPTMRVNGMEAAVPWCDGGG